MTSPGARRAIETVPDPLTDASNESIESMTWERPSEPVDDGVDAVGQMPDPAAIAEESAKIYPDTNEGAPTPEEIAIEAYAIYMAGGAQDGHDLEDWLEAERRLSQARRR